MSPRDPARRKPPDDFVQVGDLLPEDVACTPTAGGARSGRPTDMAARVVAAWPAVVGPEVACQSQPLVLRNGRLVVATSSGMWAQTLQSMAEQIRGGLNAALGEEAVAEVRFRPAGYDPGAARDAPRGLPGPSPWQEDDACEGADADADREPGAGAAPPARRALTPAEEAEIERIRSLAPTEELGDRIAAAMRATWERGPQTRRS